MTQQEKSPGNLNTTPRSNKRDRIIPPSCPDIYINTLAPTQIDTQQIHTQNK